MNSDFFILMKSELSLVLIIFLLLILKVWDGFKNNTLLLHLTTGLLLINFILGFFFNSSGNLFNGMFYTNDGIALEKNILNFGTLIIALQSFDWLKTHKNFLEFYILLLSTLLGMFYMISAGNFLLFYLGLELASIPLAALVNFDLEKRKSSEAAMKMILSSAFASGILLFGISLLYGITGTVSFAELPKLMNGGSLHLFALLFIFSGFAFKLSAVPFHFWTADVYEGAPVQGGYCLCIYFCTCPFIHRSPKRLVPDSVPDHRPDDFNRKSVCHPPEQYQAIPGFLLHCPGRVYSAGNILRKSDGSNFLRLFFNHLHFLQPGRLWGYRPGIRSNRQGKHRGL
jgi:energy-converting hydrogenase Eha subunit H